MGENFADLVKGAIGVTSDSRKVKDGYIYVAIKGRTNDGHNFIDSAVKNGAKVVIGEKDLNLNGAKYIKVQDSRELLGKIASEINGNPSQRLKVIGVTGTKGKTTTTHLIYHILTSLGKKAGLISSIAAKIDGKEIDTGFHVTSPDVVTLHEFLKEMIDAGCEYAVVEVSSHGIDQKRIAGVNFEVGVLTNIASEHLDYHKTFKEYKKVKMSFINSAKVKVVSPVNSKLNLLPGEFNNINAEAAIETAIKLGFSKAEVLKAISSFELPEGRLEKVPNPEGPQIYIDFAHTPDSLRVLLTYLKTQTKGKVIAVFGCAGERDTKKRFQMGKVAAKLADFSVFTAEDPRSENIFKILAKMAQGAKSIGAEEGKNFVRIPERGEAIAFALGHAAKNDLVVFAGKSHEKSMAYQNFENPWNDHEAISNYLNADDSKSVIVLAAGKGTRMRSQYPKVIHEICGRPMIAYTLENLRKAGLKNIIVVVSYKRNLVKRKIQGVVNFAVQKNPKGGTADAAKSGLELVGKNTKTLIVINGDDSAFYKPETIKEIIKIHENRERTLTFVSLMKENPLGLGRVVRGKNGLITKIVEEKDATEEEKKIKEVNDGLYVFDKKWFAENIEKVKKAPGGEYYLVSLIKTAIDEGKRMATFTLPNDDEWQGINTPEELAKAEGKMGARLK